MNTEKVVSREKFSLHNMKQAVYLMKKLDIATLEEA